MSVKHSLDELVMPTDSAWPAIEERIRESSHSVEVLPADEQARRETLLEMQVSTRSALGAVIFHTGGLLIDHSWLRILGSGHRRLERSITEWNKGRSKTPEDKDLGFCLVADDAIGGFFALDGGAFGAGKGEVFYFAPDTLRWEPMNGMEYGQFLVWCLTSNLGRFYEAFRWAGWEAETAALGGNEAFSIYPFLCTAEGKDINATSRRRCLVSEIFAFNTMELPKQFGAEARKTKEHATN